MHDRALRICFLLALLIVWPARYRK